MFRHRNLPVSAAGVEGCREEDPVVLFLLPHGTLQSFLCQGDSVPAVRSCAALWLFGGLGVVQPPGPGGAAVAVRRRVVPPGLLSGRGRIAVRGLPEA